MTQQRNISANFQWKYNAQSAQPIIQGNAQIAQSFQPIQNAASRAAVQFNSALQTSQALGLSSAQMQQLGLQTQNVASQAAAATTQLNSLAAASARGTPAQLLGNLAQAGIALPGVGFQSPLVVGLRAASLAADKTGASFLQVGVAGGLLGVAMVGIAVAFDHFTQGIQDAKKHLEAALVAQNKYYDAVQDLTTKEAKDRVGELARRADILNRQIAETQANRDRAFAIEQTLPGGDITARALNFLGLTPSPQLNAQLQELKKELDEVGQTFTRLKQGVSENAFALNDLLEAEEARNKALKDSSDAINDGLKDIANAAQDVEKARANIADIRQQLVDAATEAKDKSRQLAQDTDERILDAQADAEERRQQIVADGAERRQEIDRDDADRRAEILKRFNTDYFNAVADRDALAAFKAKQTRDDDLEKQDKAYRKQLDQLQRQLDKQYAAIDKALDKQLRNIQRQFERQQASIDDAYNKQLRNLNQSLNEAIAAEQFANNRLEALRSDNAFRAAYWAGVVETANQKMANAAALLANSLTQSANQIAEVAQSTDWRSKIGLIGGSSGGSGAGGIGYATGGAGSGYGSGTPLSDNNGNILTRNTARPYLGSMSNVARSPVPLYGTSGYGRGGGANIQQTLVINGANMPQAQMERVAAHVFTKTMRQAGFR